MRAFDYLIVGGGIAGTTAAETLREKDAKCSIAILEASPHPLYSRVLIPSYIKGKITRDRLFLRKFDDYESADIRFFSETAVSNLEPERHLVFVEKGGKKEEFQYNKLLIAAGGKPKDLALDPPLNKGGLGGVFRMHTIEDADLIKEMLASGTSTAVVIGESFIGIEFLEIFRTYGIETHALIRGEFFGENVFGKKIGKILEENFAKQNIILHKNSLSNPVAKWGVAGVGIGLSRNLDGFSALKINKGIITDEFLRTSNPDIFAAGDIAEYYDENFCKYKILGNWAGAVLSGRLAAENMQKTASDLAPFKFIMSYNITSFGYKISVIGDLEGDDISEFVDEDSSRALRLVLNDGKIRGAVVLNNFIEKAKLLEFIEKKGKVEDLNLTNAV